MGINVLNSFSLLKEYCESEDFKGWDPYDGLNSKLFKTLHLDRIKIFRLAWIQLFKRNPINLRGLTFVNKDYNPKGLGLFLTAYCNLYKINYRKEDLQIINFLARKIIEVKTEGFSGACWGYNFDWQNRAFFLPKGTPTVVATSFIASALFDAYDITKNENYLKEALSSVNFIKKDLNRTNKDEGFVFSYSPFDKTCVYNASLLGSKLLSRAFNYDKNEDTIITARDSVLACTNEQKSDGSWIYGEHEVQDWVDSFHTGYNLECINDYQIYSNDYSFTKNINKGLDFYLNNFFLEDGTPKYYNNKTYPIDVHSPAQFIVTLYKLRLLNKNKELIDKTLLWTIDHMQNTQKGYFYYQLKKGISSKIPYMRWAQAWMFYAFSFYLLDEVELKKKNQ